MKKVNGNIVARLQIRSCSKNSIGESVPTWSDSRSLTGFLDYASGDSSRNNYEAKTQESTHYFICDYVNIGSVTAEKSRLLIDGKSYDILLIDDPMNLHYHLEFHLKYTGGVVNG